MINLKYFTEIREIHPKNQSPSYIKITEKMNWIID